MIVSSSRGWLILGIRDFPSIVLRSAALRNDRIDRLLPDGQYVRSRNNGVAFLRDSNFLARWQDFISDSGRFLSNWIHQVHIGSMNRSLQLDAFALDPPVFVALDVASTEIDAFHNHAVGISEDFLDNALLPSFRMISNHLNFIAPQYIPLRLFFCFSNLGLGLVDSTQILG